ncbi:hypothetical protein Tco_1066127 [Tanacetum coccineum]
MSPRRNKNINNIYEQEFERRTMARMEARLDQFVDQLADRMKDMMNPRRYEDRVQKETLCRLRLRVEITECVSKFPSNYHGSFCSLGMRVSSPEDEEEEYPFVDNYQNFQEEKNNVSFPGVVLGVEEELMPVYDTDIEDVIEEEERFVEKGGFGGVEDNIKDVVVVANDLCSLMIQTTLSVDFEEDINTKSHELMSFGKSIIIKGMRKRSILFVDNYQNFQKEENNVSFSGVVLGVEEESMPVYDTDIEDVIEEEEGFVGKGGFSGEEDNIEDVVVVVNDLCSSMIQTTLSVDFKEDINTKSHELISFRKSIIIKGIQFGCYEYKGRVRQTRGQDFFKVGEDDAVLPSPYVIYSTVGGVEMSLNISTMVIDDPDDASAKFAININGLSKADDMATGNDKDLCPQAVVRDLSIMSQRCI